MKASSIDTHMGSIAIDTEAIAQYAGVVATECFGIVGMAGISMKDGLVKLFLSTIHNTFHTTNVGIPNSIRSSMRMADIISEMSAFTTNITFSHLCTS